MSSIGLFYGTEIGATEDVARLIGEELGKEVNSEIAIEDIGQTTSTQMQKYDFLIFGLPTWDDGKMDWDWEWFLGNGLDNVNFNGKKVALFGLGDQEKYGETFLGALTIIYKKLAEKGVEIIGQWSTDGYNNTQSTAIINEQFVGLAIDEDTQPDLTEDRVKMWVEQLKREIL
ncbi:MAG: flavodoxin [Candidatus Hodarchaeales archaeon]|jgi:flavodoxin I